MVPPVTTTLPRFTGEWATLLPPDMILAVCRELGYTARRDRLLTPVTTMQRFLLQLLHGTPPAVICPISRACGSRRRPIVKPARDSRGTSLTSS